MKRFALFVGINNYTNGITPLKCACNDAQQLSFEFASNGYSPNNIKLLLNENGHCDDVEDELRNISDRMTSGDLLIFYFAGHGRELNGEHFLIGPRGHAKKELFRRGSLAVSELISITNKPGIYRLFILDCCRDNLLSSRSTSYACDEARSIALDKVVAPNSDAKIIPPLILNSCSPGEKAYEDASNGHGFFTNALLSTIAMKTLHKFADMRRCLQEKMNPPGEQHICWNGSVDSWDDVRLFEKWASVPDLESPVPIHREVPEKFYKLAAETELLEQKFKNNAITLPEKLQLLKRQAEMAKADGNYDLAAESLQQFSDHAKTEFEKASQSRYAEEKYRMAESSGIIFSSDRKTVTGVKDKKQLTKVEIPDGVTAIGKNAFAWCSDLTAVTLPGSVTSIEDSAFKMCKNLRGLNIPQSVQHIGEWAFRGTGLMNINLPQKCTYTADGIKASFPAECTVSRQSIVASAASAEDLQLSEDGKTVIKVKNKKLLINAVIPEGVAVIGKNAFAWCSNLTVLTIPESVTVIEDSAFKMCKNLRTLNIPQSVKQISEWAFWGTGLQQVTLAADCQYTAEGVKASFPENCIISKN